MSIHQTLHQIAAGLLAILLAAPVPGYAQGTGGGENGRPYRIFAVVWRGETEVEAGFRDYLNQRGIPYELTVRNLELDRANAPPIVEEIRRTKPDLVYTWGTGTTLSIVGDLNTDTPDKFIRDIPAIFVMVAYPQVANIIKSYENTGRMVSGVSFLAPLDVQLNVIRAYRPFRKLAAIYDKTARNSRINIEQLQEAVPKSGMEFLPVPVPLNEDGKPDPDTLPDLIRQVKSEGADVLYIGPDSFLARHGTTYTRTAVESGLPVFASNEVTLKSSHSMFGLVSEYYTLGKLAGLQAEKILVDGINPRNLPIAQLSRFKFWVNIDVVKALGVYPPMNMISIADFKDSGLQ